jgi:D-serine deaminase-like pyridoxal phosphate-dependent protein
VTAPVVTEGEGALLSQLDTPCLVVDVAAAERNVERMAEFFAARRDVRLRPHVKTHKSPVFAQQQLDAGGTSGIACQKLSEAEVMVDAGLATQVLVTNQVVGELKTRKLAALNRRGEVLVCVDSAANVDEIARAAEEHGVEIGVLVEVDVGYHRCGVASVEEAVRLARHVAGARGVRLEGLQCFEGHLVLEPDPETRADGVARDLERVVAAREAIEAAGIPVNRVDAGSTTTYRFAADVDGIDEIQAGTYVFMDVLYRDLAPEFELAASVLATVISRNVLGRAVIDVGTKAMSSDENVLPVLEDAEVGEVVALHEEHGILRLGADCHLTVGDKVRLVPGHVCTTVNLYDQFVGVRGDRVVAAWDIPARGKST